MAERMTVACVQMTSGIDIQENMKRAEDMIRNASDQGASFVVTPENTCHIRHPALAKKATAKPIDQHEGVPFFSELSKELGITLLIGSMTVKGEDGKLLNRSFLFASNGDLIKTYDKIHLFDVNLGHGESYRESDIYQAGAQAVVAPIGNGFTLGLSICYDLRFPHFYRDLAKAGANILCVPAAFTIPTGNAHWEILLRARAIETGSYVMAAGQVGIHENGRETYGHSMIVNPWGEVVAEKKLGEGVILGDINISDVNTARSKIPALTHDRAYNVSPV